MGQDRKKQAKLVANRYKQKKFTARYSNYTPQKKFIINEPQANREEPEVTKVNNEEVLSAQNTKELPVNTAVANEETPTKQEATKRDIPKVHPVDPEPPKPEVKDFYNKLSDRMGSTEITSQVKSEITEIIKSAGITEQQDVNSFVEKSYSDIKEHINLIYDPKLVSETKMSVDAASFFYVAYRSLMESDLTAPDQIIAAQKISNVMIKNYSPVAFADKGLGHYADNYVLKNKEEFETQLELLGFTDTQAMMEEVYATLEGRQIKKEEPLKEEVPVDPDSVDMAAFTKSLQPMLDDTEAYKGYNVFMRLAVKNTLKDAGVDVGEESDPLECASVIRDAYAPEKLSREAPQPMRNVAKSLFISTYNALTQKGINTQNNIETTQKITNEFIKRYSPALIDENLLKYANDYVTNDNALFRECLTALKFPEKEIKAIVDDKIDGARLHNTMQLFTSMPSMNARINSNISNILKEAEVGADKTNALDINEILADAYAPNKISNASIPMRDVAKHVFMSTYAAMAKKDVTPKNKVETAQKITDELLKNYSPIAYTEQKLNEYANNYVINDKGLLRECLTTLKLPENEIKAIVGDTEEKKAVNQPQETKPVSDEARVAVYMEKLKTYNNMYKLNVDSNNFASDVSDAWELITSGDKQKMADGQKIMNNLFKDTLKKAFDVEKGVAYDEHRLPDYAEIIKSTNELMRSAMYGFTDMYHNAKRSELFDSTAFGALNDKDLADLTVGQSLWSMDQKSDEAWEIQSKEAKNIADKWLEGDKPYEKMIAEMKALVKSNEEGIVSRKEMIDKLTAAEWLLVNNEKMMVEDPEDPLNPIPNWGNRYWKTLSETREALGIDKHTSMRDMIQADYAASAKAVNNRSYNLTQINYYVLDKDVRELADSMEVQKEQFATQSAHVTLTESKNEKISDDLLMTADRVQISVNEVNQREIMKNEPKNYDFKIERTAELSLSGQTK